MVPGSAVANYKIHHAGAYEESGHINEDDKNNCCPLCGTEKSANTNAAHWEPHNSSGKCRCYVDLPGKPKTFEN